MRVRLPRGLRRARMAARRRGDYTTGGGRCQGIIRVLFRFSVAIWDRIGARSRLRTAAAVAEVGNQEPEGAESGAGSCRPSTNHRSRTSTSCWRTRSSPVRLSASSLNRAAAFSNAHVDPIQQLKRGASSAGIFTSPLTPRFARRTTSSAWPRDWQSTWSCPAFAEVDGVVGENMGSSDSAAGRSSGMLTAGVGFGLLPDPLGQRRGVLKFGRVPDVGRQVVNAESLVVRLGPLLHLLDFDHADIAEVPGGRFVQPADQFIAFLGIGHAQQFKDGIVQVAPVGLLQFIRQDQRPGRQLAGRARACGSPSTALRPAGPRRACSCAPGHRQAAWPDCGDTPRGSGTSSRFTSTTSVLRLPSVPAKRP